MMSVHDRKSSTESCKEVLLDIELNSNHGDSHSEKSRMVHVFKYILLVITFILTFLAGYLTAYTNQVTSWKVSTDDVTANEANIWVDESIVGINKSVVASSDVDITHKSLKTPLAGCTDNKHYLFLNRHPGVSQDIQYLSHQLNFTFDEIDKDELWDDIKDIQDVDFLSEAEANKKIIDRLAEWVCYKYPLVIVGDINGDGRFLLQKIDKNPSSCKTKRIIFWTTNRFDFHASHVEGENKMDRFHDLIKRVKQKTANGNGPEVMWIANNPYEPKYAEIKLGEPLMSKVVRPLGISSVPKAELKEEEKDKAVIYGGFFTSAYFEELKSKKIQVYQLDHDYGGPLTLAQYKAFIEFPYQVSTIKLYENLAAGVTMLIPSHRFYQELMDGKGPSDAWYWGFNIVDDFNYKSMGSNWYEYVDYYHKDFQDYIYYFDSYQELSSLLQQPIIDTRNVKEKGPKMYEQVRSQSLMEWQTMLQLQVC